MRSSSSCRAWTGVRSTGNSPDGTPSCSRSNLRSARGDDCPADSRRRLGFRCARRVHAGHGPAFDRLETVRTALQAALEAISDLLEGMIAQQTRGAGSDFDALVEFMLGMDRRSIDWKQSGRHSKLLSKQY